jgi:DnaJ-class molecular chaperone
MNRTCSHCNGKGYTEEETTIEVNCPFCKGKFILREGITFLGLFSKFCRRRAGGK